MKVLVLGGTAFLGRHIVEAALAGGHEVTLFNRGQRDPDAFADVEQLRGDRNGDLAEVRGRRWDAVIDTSGYLPRQVQASAGLLADAVEHYIFISSISVYARLDQPGIDETAPVATLDAANVEEVTSETYGALKALCEQAAEAAMPGRVLVLRPGLIVGPYDYMDRFPYWVGRVARGGEVLAPGQPGQPVQIIDARDIAGWSLRMAAARQVGVYNTTGPGERLTMGQLLEACKQVTGSDARFTWVDEAFLVAHEVGAWEELPLWVPSTERDMVGILQVNIDKAVADGLRFRPLVHTVRDTWAWLQTLPADRAWRAGLSTERETELLAQWKQGIEDAGGRAKDGTET